MNLNYTINELAEIWNTLNNWDWDNRLGIEPFNWQELPNYVPGVIDTSEVKAYYINPIMKKIENEIGIKECLKWLHINKLNRNEEQFEKWWANKYL